ncbi:MAG: TIGR02281 family clan AA aspartic protease [Pseudomonadota bacterium]
MALYDGKVATQQPPVGPHPDVSPGLKWGPLAIVAFWVVVLGVLYALITQYLKPKPVTITAQGELIIPKARDGHFYAAGTVNGRPVMFMVDTGASLVAVSEAFARGAGVGEGVPTTFHTANGDMPGRIVQDVPVTLGPIQVSGVRVGVGLVGGAEDQALLGQSFLSKFDITMSKEKMVLRPR